MQRNVSVIHYLFNLPSLIRCNHLICAAPLCAAVVRGGGGTVTRGGATVTRGGAGAGLGAGLGAATGAGLGAGLI